MNCGYSSEILALYVEDDLPTIDSRNKVEAHIQACADCRRYCDELRHSQAFIKSAFRPADHQSFSQETLANVRRCVMSQINTVQQSFGWPVRLERFLMSGLRMYRYAIVSFAIIAIVSASLAQIRHSAGRVDNAAAIFVAGDTLICPSSYREWVFVGCSFGKTDSLNHSSEAYYNVYIDPVAYREYSRSGRFPDGTVMVLEGFSSETKPELQVSVKDSSRFKEGWGFYDFTEAGELKSQAKPLPEIAGCLACHRDKAATDHVFTQFYPVLRAPIAKL